MSETKPYQPSNGTEGDIFMGKFCFKCVKLPHDTAAKNQCNILLHTFVYDIGDQQYPKEWISISGKPACTAFKDRDEANAERRESRKPQAQQGDIKTRELF